MIFILLDEGVSPKIAEAAERIGIPEGVAIDSVNSQGMRGAADEDWMTALSKRGRAADLRVAFSADNFSDPERALAETLKITLFSTPIMYWRPLLRHGQAAYVLRWLPRIIELARAHPAGSQFRLPHSFNTGLQLQPLRAITTHKTRRSGRPAKPRPRRAAPLLDGKV